MTNESDAWTACSPREITRLAGRLHARRQRRVVGRAAALAALAAVAIVAVAVWIYPARDQGPDFAGISCQRVSELAEAYRIKELPPDLQDQVGRHIALCPICRGIFETMPGVSRHRRGDIHGPLVLARHGPSP